MVLSIPCSLFVLLRNQLSLLLSLFFFLFRVFILLYRQSVFFYSQFNAL